MVVVPPAVATTASTVVVGVKGGAFYASGEISSAAAVKDEAGTMSRRLREASQQLSQQLTQQLSQVS
jgi:flagellar biogenesis protein FliO